MTTRRRDGAAGAIAAAMALGAGELVAGLDAGGPSLVTAVGDEVIDGFAASLKDLAVELFGTNDKAALVVGIVVVAVGLGALLGVLTRRHRWIGPVGFAAFGVVGSLALRQAALSDDLVAVAAGVVAVAAGVLALEVLLRSAARASADHEVSPDDGTSEAPPMRGAPRRAFLLTSAGFVVGAGATAALGRVLRAGDPTAELRSAITLPAPERTTALPAAQPFDVPGLSPYVTPTPDFYRIDTALTVPRVDPRSWSLTVDGLVDRPFSMRYEELLELESIEVPVTLQCVSNEVGGDLVGNAVWQGVPLSVLLDRAGVRPEGTQVIGRSVDGWTAGFPTDLVGDGRTALVAYGMNGQPLPPRHGFPARLVVAGLYGYVSATKWLEQIQLTRWEDVDGYWIPRGWSKEGPIKLTSRIDVPRAAATIEAGPTAVAGVAWAPTTGIAAVEVRVDEGPWEACQLGTTASDETWVQWHRVWEATPGSHVLEVRATSTDGEVQTAELMRPAPDGATGHHTRRVDVS